MTAHPFFKCFLILIIAFLSSCQASKSQLSFEYIKFGSAGGFTGETSGFMLLSNGELSCLTCKQDKPKSTVSKKELKQISLICSDLETLNYNKPDNMYQYIEIQLKSNQSKNFSWGISDQEIPEKISSLYQRLNSFNK